MTEHLHLTVRQESVDDFLAGHRLAVVGASDDEKNFARTIYTELKGHGYDVVAIHPTAVTVDGDPAYPVLASAPGPIDGAVVMVGADRSADIVDQCAASGIRKVWLFRGLGGGGAVSDAAVRRCHDLGLEVVAGACPLMFLEPVGWVHRMHRSARHARSTLVS